MKKLCIYLLIVILGVLVIDILYRFWCINSFNNPKPNSNIAIAYPFISHNESCQIAILGGSKANTNYNTNIMEDSLGVKVYNYGASGESVLHQYLCLNKAIKNGNLKVAILDLTMLQISEKWVNRRLAGFYPYYWSDDKVRDMIKDVQGNRMDILLSVAMYQYNSQLHRIIFSYFKKYEDNGGFMPEPYTGDSISISSIKGGSQIDISPYAIKYLSKMSEMCRNNNVEFIVCISPDFSTSNSDIQLLNEICNNIGAEFWDYSNAVRNPYYFKEELHMNERGANQFSNLIIKRIRQINSINSLNI